MTKTEQKITSARELVKKAGKIVAFSGAGISTESGLADFRSPGGLWDRYRIVTFQEFLTSHEHRVEYWSMRRELIPGLPAMPYGRPLRCSVFLQPGQHQCNGVLSLLQ